MLDWLFFQNVLRAGRLPHNKPPLLSYIPLSRRPFENFLNDHPGAIVIHD